jgi:phage terminase large subunit-like protein
MATARSGAAHRHAVDRYAARVVDGTIPAGKYHKLSCQRHVRDRAREGSRAFPFVFDAERADRFFRFAAQLKHYKGTRWAGKPIELTPVQKFRLGSLFGWVHRETGLRRFRTAYNELPRKQGKSLEAAIVAIYVTFFDGEPGAEGYTIATKREQAKIVFRDAVQLVTSSGLKRWIRPLVNNLSRADTASKLEPLGADYDSTDGLSPNLIITDELHAMKDRGLLDVVETATGARDEPVHFQITTAGNDRVSPCGDQHDYACKILDGILDDETFFAFIAHADDGDDPFAVATWKKANPHYGGSVNPADLHALATKARHMPTALAAFKQKRLNIWDNALAPALSMDGYRRGQSHFSPDELLHEPCWAAVDLSNKLDLSALVLVFPPTIGRVSWRLLRWVWTPSETIDGRAHRDRAPYPVWVTQGHLLTTPGPTIDHHVVRPVLAALRERFDIQRIGFDPWHAHDVIRALVDEDGFSDEHVVEVPQTFAQLSSASQLLEAAVAEGHVDVGDCPLMRWSASNLVWQTDNKENKMPTKRRSRGRIDPWVAAVIAISLAERLPVVEDLVADDPELLVLG